MSICAHDEQRWTKVLELGDVIQFRFGDHLFEGHIKKVEMPENITVDPITGFTSFDDLTLGVSIYRVTKFVK